MTTLLERATQLFDKTAEVLDRAITERVQRETQVQQAIAGMQHTMLRPYIGYYDEQIVSKTTLGIEASAVDQSVSNWYPVPNTKSNHFYPVEGKLTLVDLPFAYSYAPGYPNDEAAEDKSWSFAQFVYAPDSITSKDINARLKAIGQQPEDAGSWWNGTSTVKAVAVYQPGLHNYSRLYVRFVNRKQPYFGADYIYVPQNIVIFGGSVPFKVAQVRHYPQLAG